jgi:hypothetical protein
MSYRECDLGGEPSIDVLHHKSNSEDFCQHSNPENADPIHLPVLLTLDEFQQVMA